MPRIFSCPKCGGQICWSEEIFTSYPAQNYGVCSDCGEHIHSFLGGAIKGHWDDEGEVRRLDGIVDTAAGPKPAYSSGIIRIGSLPRCSKK